MNELASPGTPGQKFRQAIMYAAIALVGSILIVIFVVVERPGPLD